MINNDNNNNVSQIKHLPYKDRLSKLGLSTMVFRLRGAMIEVFKILSGIHDQNTVPSMSLTFSAEVTIKN